MNRFTAAKHHATDISTAHSETSFLRVCSFIKFINSSPQFNNAFFALTQNFSERKAKSHIGMCSSSTGWLANSGKYKLLAKWCEIAKMSTFAVRAKHRLNTPGFCLKMQTTYGFWYSQNRIAYLWKTWRMRAILFDANTVLLSHVHIASQMQANG